jgi:glycosyltransferase involved in cell wall biosynthesis
VTQRMAVVHEWVSARAGSEQVFEALAQLYPSADLFALSTDPAVSIEVNGREIGTTVLNHRALRDRRGITLPLMPAAWRMLGNATYDVVLTSHHAFAASNRLARPGAVHLAYVHTPARYVWTPELDGRGTNPLLAPVRKALGGLDRRAASRLTGIAANSCEVARRIKQFWDRDARVIHPPVDVEYFGRLGGETMALPENYLLGLGRWIAYKNHLLIIDIAEKLRRPVVIAGSGPLEPELRARASSASVPALIFKQPSRDQVRELFQRAGVLLFPTQEDFGIVPVEAMASGTPVVAYFKGGAEETVRDGISGVLVEEHKVEAFAEGVERVSEVDRSECQRHATAFGRARFNAEIREWVSREGVIAP